jgi:hypothetical protein
MNLRQFRLVNDDELICELVQYSDDESEILVRKVLKIITADDYDNNVRYYSFKPWISFQEEIDDLSVINSMHVLTEVMPSDSLKKHYTRALKDIKNQEELSKKNVDLDAILEATENLTEEEMRVYIQNLIDDNDKFIDSNETNVITFRPKDTLH